MMKTLIYTFFCCVAILLYACVSSKQKNYSYCIGLFQVDTAKKILSESNYISFNKYLFEFNTIIMESTEVYLLSKTSSSVITKDTSSVYLMNESGICYEFDCFGLNAKVLKSFPIKDKIYGTKIEPRGNDEIDNHIVFSSPEKAINNNIEYHLTIGRDIKRSNDSIELKFTLFDSKSFQSFYKISGYHFTNDRYCIVGMSLYYKYRKSGFSEEFLERRELTDLESNICSKMISGIKKQ